MDILKYIAGARRNVYDVEINFMTTVIIERDA